MATRLTAQELAEVRRDAEGAADPLVRLAAIKRGTDHWSALLEEAVVQAREAGVGWAQIARALGVSRQAATKRFKVSVVKR